jgi:hypothetical protein
VVHTAGPHGASPCSFRPPVSVTAFFENSESDSGSCFRRERRLGLDITWEVFGNEPPVFAGDDASVMHEHATKSIALYFSVSNSNQKERHNLQILGFVLCGEHDEDHALKLYDGTPLGGESAVPGQ